MLDIIVIVIIFIFGFIFIDQLRVHEGMSLFKKIKKGVNKGVKGIKKGVNKGVSGIKKGVNKGVSGIKKGVSGFKSAVKLTNQLNQCNANLNASRNNERALTSAINVAGTKLQYVTNDMGTTNGKISSLMNTNRQKYQYKPFSI